MLSEVNTICLVLLNSWQNDPGCRETQAAVTVAHGRLGTSECHKGFWEERCSESGRTPPPPCCFLVPCLPAVFSSQSPSLDICLPTNFSNLTPSIFLMNIFLLYYALASPPTRLESLSWSIHCLCPDLC